MSACGAPNRSPLVGFWPSSASFWLGFLPQEGCEFDAAQRRRRPRRLPSLVPLAPSNVEVAYRVVDRYPEGSKVSGVEMNAGKQALTLLLDHSELQTRRVDGVWLFGSHARGTASSTSDVDLAVLCEPALELGRFRLMGDLGGALSRDVDVIDLATLLR